MHVAMLFMMWFVLSVQHSSILKLQRLYTSTLRKRSHAPKRLELEQRETISGWRRRRNVSEQKF